MSHGTDGEGFRVHDARRAGRPRRWIDGPQFGRPFHGLRAPRDTEPSGGAGESSRRRVLRSAAHWSVHMGSPEYFSHITAAIIWDLPLPGWAIHETQLHISSPGRATRSAGTIGHQVQPGLASVVDHPELGMRVADAATTWAMLGGILTHPYDLVAVGDAVVRTPRVPGPTGRVVRPALGTVSHLHAALQAGRRVGASRLRCALPQVRPGSASRPETWLRLTLVDAGLPEPVLDFDVYDERGQFVGCVDLAYPEHRIAIEYEGDQHRTDPAQWQRDIEKHERLADLGWRVVRVTRDQLFGDSGSVAPRVRRLLRSRR